MQKDYKKREWEDGGKERENGADDWRHGLWFEEREENIKDCSYGFLLTWGRILREVH